MTEKVSARGTRQKMEREENRTRKEIAKKKTKTKDAKQADSFQNFPLNLGMGTDNPLSASTYGFNPITRIRTILEWIHRGSWLGGMAIDIPADDMTRAGIEITTPFEDLDDETGKSDSEERFNAALARWDIWGKFNEGIKWGRLYGGAIVVPLIDGQDESTELRADLIEPGAFRGLLVLDRWMVEPSLGDLVTEKGPSMGLPKYYTVLSDAPALRGKRIHYSRAFRFLGVELPYWQAVMENLWSISVLERLYDRMVAFDSATTGAAQRIYKSFLRTLKLKNFRSAAVAGGDALIGIMRQVDVMRRFQSQENVTLIDADDDFIVDDNSSVSGYAEVLLQLGQQLAGALQIPLVRLFGEAPAGLNSTGDSDLATYDEGINKEQERRLRIPVFTVCSMMAKSEKISLPPNWTFIFNPLRRLSPKEQSEVANQNTQAITQAADLTGPGVALRELRAQSKRTGIFSSITNKQIGEADKMPPPIEMAMQEPDEGEGGEGEKKPKVGDSARVLDLHGIPIFIETARGETREGGKGKGAWSVVMPVDYGFIEGVPSAEGAFEELDVFVGDDRMSKKVWIIDQLDLRTGTFDEHKCMLGFRDAEEARTAYCNSYADQRGEERIGCMSPLSLDAFREWLKDGNKTMAYGPLYATREAAE